MTSTWSRQRLIVGLGNPGPNYYQTRHNAGFLLVDKLIEQWSARPCFTGQHALLWQALCGDCRVFLMKPLTYMNLSGTAVLEFLENTPVETSEILIAFDDLALALGQIRVRGKGSDGGQKGLRDISQKLDTTQLARLRLGIGPQSKDVSRSDYVLNNFDENEWPIFNQACHRACEAANDWLMDPMQIVMSRYNAKVPQIQSNLQEKMTQVEGGE